jgi:hypothetical protein
MLCNRFLRNMQCSSMLFSDPFIIRLSKAGNLTCSTIPL